MSPDFENRFTKEAIKTGVFHSAQSSKEKTLATFNKASLLITDEGTLTVGPLQKKGEKYFTLEDMQSAVGGFVDIAQLSEEGKGIIESMITSEEGGLSKEEAKEIVDDLELVVNDEGLIHGLKANPTASVISMAGVLVGPVVLARRSGWE